MNVGGMIAKISVFEMAMPTLLSAGIVAEQYDLEPPLINLVIGIGIVLSFVTTAGWWWLVNYLF
jgi:malate permease and related proteins